MSPDPQGPTAAASTEVGSAGVPSRSPRGSTPAPLSPTVGTRPVIGARSIPITSGALPEHTPSFGHRLERLTDGRLLLWCNAHPLAEWSTDVTGDPNLDGNLATAGER